MLSSFFRLILILVGSSASFSDARNCVMRDWNFKIKGEKECDMFKYLVGFERDGNDYLPGLKKAKCCERDKTFWGVPTQCQMFDWIRSMDRTGISNCPPGFYLRGVSRGDMYGNDVGSIDWGKCCKPSHHPYEHHECYQEDVSDTFNRAGLSGCKRDGFFIAGFENQDSGGKLSSIKKFKCCRMVESIPQLKNMEGLKQRVMDATMFNIGQLANMMGFAWAGGCWSRYAGEHFRRNKDTWESAYKSHCLGEGPKKDVRLKITYENFKFTMKDVKFGKSVKQTIPLDQEERLMNSPDRSYSRVSSNKKSTPGYDSGVEIQFRVASTLKNVQKTSWDSKFGLEVGMEYEPPSTTGGVGFSAKSSFSYEWGGDQEDTTVNEDWHILSIKEAKQLPPKTFSEWHAFKKPQKVTIPYTATIVPTFSVKLEGYMRWGGGYYGNFPNFHQEHRGSEDRKKLSYTFGSADKPFYDDLKDQIEQNMYPWQWLALKQRYPYSKYFIDQLTNSDLYAFTMEGQFEEITENEIKSKWYPSRPISEMNDALANLTAMQDQGEKFPLFPRIYPEGPVVKIIDNSKDIEVPYAKLSYVNEEEEPEPTVFPRIDPPEPKVRPVNNNRDLEPAPAEHGRQGKVKKFGDKKKEEPKPTIFPPINPPAPKVKPVDNSKEIKPPPVIHQKRGMVKQS